MQNTNIRYHLAKWTNARITYTEPSDMSQTSTICFYDLEKAKAKRLVLLKNGEEWSIVKQMTDNPSVFVLSC